MSAKNLVSIANTDHLSFCSSCFQWEYVKIWRFTIKFDGTPSLTLALAQILFSAKRISVLVYYGLLLGCIFKPLNAK